MVTKGTNSGPSHTEASPATRSPSRFRVLVVEDNLELAQLLTWLLRHYGFDAQMVSKGDLVLDAARSFRPHFILLDIGLPGLDGYQVAEQVRNDPALKSVVLIAVSAYGPDVHPARSHQAGFHHHLTKPVTLDDLLPLLTAC